jgi:hypothetical protein
VLILSPLRSLRDGTRGGRGPPSPGICDLQSQLSHHPAQLEPAPVWSQCSPAAKLSLPHPPPTPLVCTIFPRFSLSRIGFDSSPFHPGSNIGPSLPSVLLGSVLFHVHTIFHPPIALHTLLQEVVLRPLDLRSLSTHSLSKQTLAAFVAPRLPSLLVLPTPHAHPPCLHTHRQRETPAPVPTRNRRLGSPSICPNSRVSIAHLSFRKTL